MKKEIMTRAWEIARAGKMLYGGSVKMYFAESLRIAWGEATKRSVIDRVAEFEKMGFNRWTKGNMDRLYINARDLGLICEIRRRTGSISAAYFKGERISNSEGGRMRAAKTFIDIKTEMIYGDNSTLKEEVARMTGLKIA